MTAEHAAALVVGAGSEIGRAIARDLAGRGHPLVLWGRDPERLAASARACGGLPPVTAEVDVTDGVAVARAAGGLPADLGVAVYAVSGFDWATAAEADPNVSAGVVDVTLTGAMRVARAVLPRLLAAAPSALVLVGSTAARTPFPHNASYVAAKHGLAGFARAVFLEVRDSGVKVCLVNPGPVLAGASLYAPAAGTHPERFLRPEDVASAVGWALATHPRACPVEIDLVPQRDPHGGDAD